MNSCKGGSNRRIVTGFPFIASKMPMKSFFWYGRSSITAFLLSFSLSAKIIFRTANILDSSKNMCSVRQSPIPCAPNFIACSASSGLSALVRILSFLFSSAHTISSLYSGCVSGSASIRSNSPLYILPVVPFSVILSPSCNSSP